SARTCCQQDNRKNRKRKGRRIENMRPPPLLIPANQLLAGDPKRYHPKLQIEPIRPEPEKQIDAENDGKQTEAESVRIAPRPAEQHVERIRENQLCQNERSERVGLGPMPAPVKQHRTLGAGLDIVLLP